VWRKIERQGGGTLVIDLDQRSILTFPLHDRRQYSCGFQVEVP
jgi:hypothetical protein